MKRILCFGDSNTYGFDPQTGGRYDEQTRWPMRLERLLGDGWTVIEEGMNGRTCVMDDPTEGGYKSGASYLPPCLMSHSPLDMVVIMLGGNDTKKRFGLSAETIGYGIMQLVRLVRLYGMDARGNPPKILLIAPPPFGEGLVNTRYAGHFGPDAAELSRSLAKEYARLAKLSKCEFLDAANCSEVSTIDALHMTSKGHTLLAQGVYNKIIEAFKQK